MKKHYQSEATLSANELQSAVLENHDQIAGRPIMSYKVVGHDLELHLLGGTILTHPLTTDLSELNKPQLLALARRFNVTGRDNMTKKELLSAVRKAMETDNDPG